MKKFLAVIAVSLIAVSGAFAGTMRTAAWGPGIIGETPAFDQYQGIAANIESSAVPSFLHGSSFVDALVGVYNGTHFMNAGVQWQTPTGTDGQLFVSKDGNVTLYGSVQQSNYRNIRVRNFDPTGGVVAEWYTGGAWQIITSYSAFTCGTGNNTPTCYVQAQTKIYDSQCNATDSSSCPSENAPLDGTGLTFKNVQVRPRQGVWQDWGSIPTLEQVTQPYYFCTVSGLPAHTYFRTPKDGC